MHDPHFNGSMEMSPSTAPTATRHEVRRRLSRRSIGTWARFPGRARRTVEGDQDRRVSSQDLYRVLSPAQSNAAVNAAWNVTQRLQHQAATARRRMRQATLVAAGGWVCAAALTMGGFVASQRAEENFDHAATQSQRLIEQMRADRKAAVAAIQERNALRGDLLVSHTSNQEAIP